MIVGCDIAIASEEALFGLPEVNFGHFPAGRTTSVLTQHLRPASWLQKPVQNLQHALLNCGPMKAVGPSSG